MVQNAWSQPTSHTEPFHRLGHKLFITSRALRGWSMSLISEARLKLHMAQEESRSLFDEEFRLWVKLKKMDPGMGGNRDSAPE